ncbi:MAG: DMT family transporter [Sphingomonadales bacterium]|nr:DMT family transporter [Sphingomonadales bacterium]
MADRPTLLPVVSALTGIALFSVMDAFMKRASIDVGAYNAVLWRNVIGAALGVAPWLAGGWRGGFGGGFWPDRRRLLVHLLRSAVVAGMAVLFFYGLVRTPMAQGMALSFIAPLIALYLAALFLGEPVTRRAVMASVLALGGVFVIAAARSGEASGDHHEAMLGLAAILGSAVLYAVNLVLQRHQAQLAGPIEIAFFQNLFVALVAGLAAPWLGAWPALPGEAAPLAVVTGAAVLAFVSLMLLSWAYARAEAHRLLPIEYSAFVWSAAMGWLWFGEPVGLATLAGVVLIVGGCVIGTTGDSPTEQTAL